MLYNKKLVFKSVIIFLCLFYLNGCSHVLSRYDVSTFKNLTDFKSEVKFYFEECVSGRAVGQEGMNRLLKIKLLSVKAYEFEKGKALNKETISQFKVIDETFTKAIKRYDKNVLIDGKCISKKELKEKDITACTSIKRESCGCLKEGYCKAKSMVLGLMFDTAIETEQSKIK